MIKGTAARPRISVFRSSKYIYGQIIDDRKGETMVSASDLDFPSSEKKKTKTERARIAGGLLAQKALEKGIKTAVFNRGHYRYHGRIKALADGAREKGLKF